MDSRDHLRTRVSRPEQRMETVEQLVSFHHIQVQLHGGAPWGFTLKGGLEHGEPLIITKIEEGGKAAQCRKLRVGDELVNICGSELYGSRQEALVLIKGSYRTLRMVVRRRNVPVIRPHSWHLAKLLEPPGIGPDPPSAMQLHSMPFSAPWHSGGDNSDPSMQWNQLSGHCSTDHSGSLGSMESLDLPSQGYYENQLSPVDPAIFNNKRDSAYSSFSASSNTSDCTVSLRHGEAGSTDNLLQGLGRNGESRPLLVGSMLNEQPGCLSQTQETKPASVGCEEEQGGTGAARGCPQPPMRRDSFRATRGHVEALDKPSANHSNSPECHTEDPPADRDLSPRSYQCDSGGNDGCEGVGLEQYYTLSYRDSSPATCLSAPEAGSLTPSPTPPDGQSRGGFQTSLRQHLTGGHRHSAPEKLLSDQLQQLELSRRLSRRTPSPGRQCPGSPAKEQPDVLESGLQASRRLDGSRSSTPALGQEPEPSGERVPCTWGRSLSVPAGTTDEREGKPEEASSPVEVQAEEYKGAEPQPKPGSSRQRRLARSRRRNERFATNLRNEIQRKKAQLQKSRGPGTPLYGDETVEEEESGVELQESEAACPLSAPSAPALHDRLSAPQPCPPSPSTKTRCPPPVAQRPQMIRPACAQVADEPGSAGKVRRWRWTPEHKLQPEAAPEQQSDTGARPSRGRTTSSRSSRTDECDILPFADRMRFFEQTSRSVSMSSLPGSQAQNQRHHSLTRMTPPWNTLVTNQRRYSYQGCAQRPAEGHGQRVSEREEVRPPPGTKKDTRPQNHAQSYPQPPTEHPESRHPRSAFRPVTALGCQGRQPLHPGYRSMPTEAHPLKKKEQTNLSRNYSLTERDNPRYKRDIQPADGAGHLGYESRWGDSKVTAGEQCLQQGRALSENDVRLGVWRPRAPTGEFAGPVLSELEESSPGCRKKRLPPPRPPPPNWAEFHRRRASQQNLFTTPSPPPPRDAPGPQCSGPPRRESPLQSDLDVTRQRSHSLPLGVETGQCQRCSQEHLAPVCGPTFPHGAFRPVAPPPKEPELPIQHPDPPRLTNRLRPLAEPCQRSCDSGTAGLAGGDRPTLLKPVSMAQRCTAEWDRRPPQGGHCGPWDPVTGNTPHHMTSPYEARTSTNATTWHQGEPCSLLSTKETELSPACPEDSQPFETDIDEFQDSCGEDEATLETEVQGFAQPAMVLETDIDVLSETEPRPPPSIPRHPCCPTEALSAADTEFGNRADLLAELLPPAGQEEQRAEMWRGCHRVSLDSLERRSRQGPPGPQISGPGHTHCCPATCSAKELSGGGDEEDDQELSYKKQLMESLRRKLGVLREAQRGLQEEVRANARLGEGVEALVLAVCRPGEVDKFRMLVGDLDKVVSLLLSLSGRLLRVESTLEALGPDAGHHEKLPLQEKKQQLLSQLGEARELKEHVDRREQAVCLVLSRCLTAEQLRDYSHFVKMKAALLVEQRQLEDKIRLGEEQLRGLKESLGLGLGLPLDLGSGYY
nr:protein Shroom4-like isoform X1 [Paramormyrops kingsleyae]